MVFVWNSVPIIHFSWNVFVFAILSWCSVFYVYVDCCALMSMSSICPVCLSFWCLCPPRDQFLSTLHNFPHGSTAAQIGVSSSFIQGNDQACTLGAISGSGGNFELSFDNMLLGRILKLWNIPMTSCQSNRGNSRAWKVMFTGLISVTGYPGQV